VGNHRKGTALTSDRFPSKLLNWKKVYISRDWVKQIIRDERVQTLFIGIAALTVRCVYWLIAFPVNAGDTQEYLSAAQNVLHGNFSFLIEFPFHALYSLLLVPGFLLPGGMNWYIALLHISLSTLSVLLLYLISRQISPDRRVHILVGLVGTFYPGLLFWLPYILTETAYFFLLLVFVYLLIIALRNPNWKNIVYLTVAAVFLLASRPVSMGILCISVVILAAVLMKRAFPRRWALFTGVLVVSGLALLFALLSLPNVRQRVLQIPTVSQSLWLSTHIITGATEEWNLYANLPPDIAGLTGTEVWEYKSSYALNFIKTQPYEYLWMAAGRFFNYWYPWVHPQWSLRHRVFDAILTISMTILAIIGLRVAENKKLPTLLVVLALTFGLVTAFSQIDPDARYRVPAEILLIPVACIGLNNCVLHLGQLLHRQTANMPSSG